MILHHASDLTQRRGSHIGKNQNHIDALALDKDVEGNIFVGYQITLSESYSGDQDVQSTQILSMMFSLHVNL